MISSYSKLESLSCLSAGRKEERKPLCNMSGELYSRNSTLSAEIENVFLPSIRNVNIKICIWLVQLQYSMAINYTTTTTLLQSRWLTCTFHRVGTWAWAPSRSSIPSPPEWTSPWRPPSWCTVSGSQQPDTYSYMDNWTSGGKHCEFVLWAQITSFITFKIWQEVSSKSKKFEN